MEVDVETSLTNKQSGNSLRISTDDAASASIEDGDPLDALTEHGTAAVPPNVTDDIRPGVVSLTHGWRRSLFHPETQTIPETQGTNADFLTG